MSVSDILKYGEVSKILSEKFKADIEAIKIKKIEGKFGAKTFHVIANLYNSKEDKDAIEVKSKKQRDAEKKAVEDAKKAEEEAKAKEAEDKPFQKKVSKKTLKKSTKKKSSNKKK